MTDSTDIGATLAQSTMLSVGHCYSISLKLFLISIFHFFRWQASGWGSRPEPMVHCGSWSDQCTPGTPLLPPVRADRHPASGVIYRRSSRLRSEVVPVLHRMLSAGPGDVLLSALWTQGRVHHQRPTSSVFHPHRLGAHRHEVLCICPRPERSSPEDLSEETASHPGCVYLCCRGHTEGKRCCREGPPARDWRRHRGWHSWHHRQFWWFMAQAWTYFSVRHWCCGWDHNRSCSRLCRTEQVLPRLCHSWSPVRCWHRRLRRMVPGLPGAVCQELWGVIQCDGGRSRLPSVESLPRETWTSLHRISGWWGLEGLRLCRQPRCISWYSCGEGGVREPRA